jgi:hypothetical protein
MHALLATDVRLSWQLFYGLRGAKMTSSSGLLPSVLILAFAASAVAAANGQGQTILEMLAAGATGRVRTVPSGAPPTIAELLQDTDVIVRGIVGQPRRYLSEDQRDVFTDYPILNPWYVYQPVLVTSKTPSAPGVVVVTQLGGAVTVNGARFTQTEEGLLPLESGIEGLFFLKRDRGRLFIVGTFFGAFRVVDGKLVPLTPKVGFAPEYRDLSVGEALEHMIVQLRAIGK